MKSRHECNFLVLTVNYWHSLFLLGISHFLNIDFLMPNSTKNLIGQLTGGFIKSSFIFEYEKEHTIKKSSKVNSA